jgi:hypothetical protein
LTCSLVKAVELTKAQQASLHSKIESIQQTYNINRARTSELNWNMIDSQFTAASRTPLEVEAVSQKAEIELAKVLLQYSMVTHPRICEDTCSKLPLELRRIIHEYLGAMQEEVFVRRTRQAGGARTYVTTMYANRTCTDQFHPPWYFDPTIVGDDFAQDIATTWYRRPHFTVLRAGDVGGFLRNRGFSAVTPKIVVHKIDVTIDCRTHKNTTWSY